MQASVSVRADPDSIEVKYGASGLLGHPGDYGAGRNPGAPFVKEGKVVRKLTSLGSGFRRNDARCAIFVVCIIPETLGVSRRF